jgi:hypothetical protein
MEMPVTMLPRLVQLAPLALAGLLGIALPRTAAAVVPPQPVMQTVAVQPQVSAVPAYYYYHGRRYPYRYHGMYFNHRYYRGGRYHYY